MPIRYLPIHNKVGPLEFWVFRYAKRMYDISIDSKGISFDIGRCSFGIAWG